MKKSFAGYYRPSEEEFEELWKGCLFVLDANVLLNLYRYPKGARDDLLKALRRISDRLWLPHQAALEYQENRLGVIAEQVRKFDEVRKILRDSINGLKAELAGLQLKKRHSAIDPGGFLARVERQFSNFEADLDRLEKEQPDVYSDDALRDQIDELLEGKVGTPLSSEALETAYQEAKTRYEQSYPPGYADVGKAKSSDKERPFYFFNGQAIKCEYGDLILWFQIISHVRVNGVKHVALITDDEKPDWWWIVESKGKKTVGPRPELVDEIRYKADVSLFYMYNSERFLQFAKKYLGIEIEQESIKQVQEITELRRTQLETQSIHAIYYHLEQAVAEWIKSSYPNDELVFSGMAERGVDLVRISQETGHRIGYEIKFSRSQASWFILMRDVVRRGARMLLERSHLHELNIVLISEDQALANKMRSRIRREAENLPGEISIVVGVVVPNDEPEGAKYKFVPLPGI